MEGTSSTTYPYQAFAEVFSNYHKHQDYSIPGPSSSQLDKPLPYDVVLEEEGGMVAALMNAVEQTIRSKSASGTGAFDDINDDQFSAEEYEALKLEHRTWQLLRAVYDNRLSRADPNFSPGSAESQLHENPYITPEDLTQTIVNEDPELSLWVTLVEHLQIRPLLNTPPPIEARHGYLPSTLRKATAQRLPSAPNTPPSLDPDFTLRNPHGQGLAGEDQTYQTPLLDNLFDLVRYGELDQAIKVCEQGGEPWRGASLMGGRRWSMGGLSQESSLSALLTGNRMRALWKKSCRAIAKNPILSPSERHLYAALISDLPTLLPACETWEDYLWAHIQHRIESRISQRWHELGGFWEEESTMLGKDDEEDIEIARGGLDDVFDSLSTVQKDGVIRASHDPYYVAQRMIILGRTPALLNQFADRIAGLEESVSPELVGPLLRFFAHLVLILRTLDQSVPDGAANIILQAYLQILEREGNDQLVAMYAACLREGNGEESYARYLRSMDPETSREARRTALSRAKQHNLDVTIIAQETVRLVLEEAFATIPALASGQPDITQFVTGISERDVHLIRSIEWLTMIPETFDEALIKSNDVARYFLALGQANAAQSLLRTLPDGIAVTRGDDAMNEDGDDDPDNHQLEHGSFRQLFGVFGCHDGVVEVLAREPKSTATKVEQHNWRKSLGSAIQRTHDATIDLLTSDWMRFRVSSSSENGSQRKKEMRRIRQIFVPDLVLRLHNLLMDNRTHFPSLLQQALDLTKTVTAEDYHVYEEFFGKDDKPYRLLSYLDKVREASMAALEGGSGNPFKALGA